MKFEILFDFRSGKYETISLLDKGDVLEIKNVRKHTFLELIAFSI